MRNNGLSRLVNSTIHAHDKIMLKSCICILEKGVEVALKCLKQGFRDLVLNRGWKLIVEVKFFNNQIEIINKSILDKLFDRVIQLVWNLFLAVTILKS